MICVCGTAYWGVSGLQRQWASLMSQIHGAAQQNLKNVK